MNLINYFKGVNNKCVVVYDEVESENIGNKFQVKLNNYPIGAFSLNLKLINKDRNFALLNIEIENFVILENLNNKTITTDKITSKNLREVLKVVDEIFKDNFNRTAANLIPGLEKRVSW